MEQIDLRVRFLLALACRTVTGLLSLAVSSYGVRSFGWADFRQDTVVAILLCLLPVLSFPVFLLHFRWFRWSVSLHWILAAGYLTVYSLLDWRTCSELGYCQGVLPTVLEMLTARPVQAAFAVAVFNLAALLLNGARRSASEATP
jgi:hypothetical protein